ncbi:MAG: tellurite resistance TerB family protein [Cyanobacteriota bacterium]|nr:tellurite resistance TerB family protein [Cyanobacteriota bacterium]
MDLFSGLSTRSRETNVSFSPAEAFAAIALATVAADGYLSDEEARIMMASLARMELFRSYSNDVMARLFDKLCGITKRQGSDALIKVAIASLPHHLHDTAFAVATDLVLADGEVTEEEENLLQYLYTNLNIPDEKAKNIVDAMIIKNKG